MFGCVRQKPGAGTVRRLPVATAVAKQIVGGGDRDRCDNQREKKQDHVFFHEGKISGDGEENASNVVRPAVFASSGRRSFVDQPDRRRSRPSERNP
jgi:hypothetical protein